MSDERNLNFRCEFIAASNYVQFVGTQAINLFIIVICPYQSNKMKQYGL